VSERVLVVPTAVLRRAGAFQGFSDRVEHYLPALLDCAHLRYAPRDEAETDPELKQLIPYVVLRHGGRVFHYLRGGGGERRLHAKRSVGIGGHICADDGAADAEAYRAGMWRELSEEVEVPPGGRERCVGLINDDRTAVGQVHLGIVHVLDLPAPLVQSREGVIVAGGFAAPAELRAAREAFETWSQFLLDGPWLEAGER
jgi:predicted NUDIX family phosphoesterase